MYITYVTTCWDLASSRADFFSSHAFADVAWIRGLRPRLAWFLLFAVHETDVALAGFDTLAVFPEEPISAHTSLTHHVANSLVQLIKAVLACSLAVRMVGPDFVSLVAVYVEDKRGKI